MIIVPDLSTPVTVGNVLDSETTPLCTSTPTGAGLDTALTTQQSNLRYEVGACCW